MIKYTSQKLAKALGLIALSGLSGLSFSQTFNWSQAGPVYNAGRARNMIVDKADPSGNTLYTGNVSSGVFKSTNGGATWAAVNATTTIRNISYMAQGLDNVIYAATGEGFLRVGQKAKAQIGTGFYKLTGSVFTQLSSAAVTGSVITRIACHPSNSQIIVLATNLGILKSIDGGNSFNVLTGGLPSGPLVAGQDVEFDNNGILYCTLGSEVVNLTSTRVFKSTDNTLSNFTEITPVSSVLTNSLYGRIELAVAPSNNNVIYASVANKAGNPVGPTAFLKGLFVSYDAGASWGLILQGSAQLDPMTNGATTSSGDYAHTILVNPTNPNQIFIGGYLFYVFTRTGGTDTNPIGAWIQVGTPYIPNFQYYLHENLHDIRIVNSSTGVKFYFVTDAGIYRSTDLISASVFNAPSFQPFYKGLVTGQFNSVSIESLPTSTNAATGSPGDVVTSNNGFIGGTGGNGFTYFSGNMGNDGYPQAAQETNYLSGEIYNVEYSKILPNAAYISAGKDDDGSMYRSSDVRISAPLLLSVNNYSGALAQITPISYNFLNNANTTSGSTFKLWENYGQVAASPDSLVFYNDSVRIQTSFLGGVQSLTTQTTFTFAPGRPNKHALIDSIAIRTGTVVYDLNATKVPVPYTNADKKDILLKLPNTYTFSSTGVTTPTISTMMGPVSAAGVTLDASSGLDAISVTFTAPPFANKTSPSHPGSADPSVYYKVFATIFYKYKMGDSVTITDNSISTKPIRYGFKLPTDLRWSATDPNGPKPAPLPTNPTIRIPTRMSARLAIAYNGGGTGNSTSIIVSKSPLNLNDPLSFVRVSANGALTTDANGVSTNSVINISSIGSSPNNLFTVKIIEWSKSGTELYYVTDENKLFRVSNLFTIMDNTPASYYGKLSTDIFKYNSAVPSNPLAGTTPNPASPYRTTLLGTFTKPVSSISISNDDAAMAVTFNDPTGTMVMYSSGNIKTSDYTNINFVSKNGTGLSNLITYCSMTEKDDSKKVFIGTDNGIFYTSNITAASPQWVNIGNGDLPNVQVFDIKQQTLPKWQSYNSGQIYIATNGRGVWTNKTFLDPTIVSINEQEKPKSENNLSLYPNPTNGNVFVSFSSLNGESATLQVMDINGRIVKSESMGKLYYGKTTYAFETSELSAGIYIVNVSSDATVKRVAKLIVTK